MHFNRRCSGLFTCRLMGGTHPTMKWETFALYKTWKYLEHLNPVASVESDYLGVLEHGGIVIQ